MQIGEDGDFQVKICDFGVSTVQEDETRVGALRHSGFVGTCVYTAPEIRQTKSFRAQHAIEYGTSVDVFSAGIMMWELWCGRDAFADVKGPRWKLERAIDQEGRRPEFDAEQGEAGSPHAMALMRSAWDADPSKRPTFRQMLASLQSSAQAENMDNVLPSLPAVEKSVVTVSQDLSLADSNDAYLQNRLAAIIGVEMLNIQIQVQEDRVVAVHTPSGASTTVAGPKQGDAQMQHNCGTHASRKNTARSM